MLARTSSDGIGGCVAGTGAEGEGGGGREGGGGQEEEGEEGEDGEARHRCDGR